MNDGGFTAACLALLIGLITGYLWGHSDGVDSTLQRDHIQATAGIFIDGYDKNKIYKIVPVSP